MFFCNWIVHFNSFTATRIETDLSNRLRRIGWIVQHQWEESTYFHPASVRFTQIGYRMETEAAILVSHRGYDQCKQHFFQTRDSRQRIVISCLFSRRAPTPSTFVWFSSCHSKGTTLELFQVVCNNLLFRRVSVFQDHTVSMLRVRKEFKSSLFTNSWSKFWYPSANKTSRSHTASIKIFYWHCCVFLLWYLVSDTKWWVCLPPI